MPLDSILILIAELYPKISSLASTPSRSTNQAAFDFLKSVTLAGLLPQPPPVKLRPFIHSANSQTWMQSLIW
jgi:hypothetical protein